MRSGGEAQIGTGAGLAFAEKYKGTDNVCLTFFGDGAARQGILHETFNMSMLWKIPVIFICENNNYAMGTSVERTSNVKDIYILGEAYDMPSEAVDGMSPEAVHEAVERAVAKSLTIEARMLRQDVAENSIEFQILRQLGMRFRHPGLNNAH